ncbi:TlpA family protein disulfide reductase [Saprospiraceae bacterium]|nr:TlpA family protein disulfide reductase [Bacteroidota bacterium]MDB4727230.1 TlpA family protein disulfide reductase [Saprospiraceae bacterium]
MKLLTFLLFATMFIISCGNETEAPIEKTENEPQKQEITPENTAANFPIYTSFNQFEHWLHKESDTTYVVNFWATWCKPCVAELPYFETLTEKYGDQKVKVVLVSLDFPNQLHKKLIPFVEEHQLKSDVVALFDGNYNDWIENVDLDWDGAIPVTLIYNNAERKFIGKQFHDFEDLEKSFKEVLGKQS